MEEELKEVLIQKDYNKAIEITMKILNNMDKSKIENWVTYKKILEFKISDEGYFENYVKPLTIELLKEYSELKDYIRQVCIINEALQGLYDKLERDFAPYRRGCMLFTAYITACKYEEFLHNLKLELINYKEDKVIEKVMNIYLVNVDKCIKSLNRMACKIYDEKDNFSNDRGLENIKQFIGKIKNESESDFINIMCRLNSVEDVLDMVKNKDACVISYGGNEFQLKYSFNKVLKYDLPRIRQRNFDNINFIKHLKDIPIDFNLLEAKDIQQYIEISEDAFRLKIDFLSDEFFTNIKTVLIDNLRYTEFILFDNYIDISRISQNVILQGKTMRFTFDDLLYFHIAIWGIANYYYIAEEVFLLKTQKHSITPIINLDKNQLKMLIGACLMYCLNKNISDEALDELIYYYTFGAYGIYDVFCTPLLRYEEKYIIMPSVIMATNFGRVFIEHISRLEIDLKKGNIFEENFKIMLRDHDFQVYSPEKPQLNFTTRNGHTGDIDILAIKDNYIFCAQLKNKPMPLEQQEFVNYDRKLYKPLKQLKYVTEFIGENPKKILDFYGIMDLSGFKIICLIVSNSFYRSGECLDGIYTIDMSALNVLFDSGKITIYDGEEKIIKYLRKGNKVTAEEFENFLQDPYFLWEGVYF